MTASSLTPAQSQPVSRPAAPAGVAALPAPRRVPLWAVSIAFWSVVVLLIVARHAGAAQVPALATFGVIFSSIVIEALPFILLGAAVSALIAVYVPQRVFTRIGRLPRPVQLPVAAFAGLAFPVCECGSVPVARRMIVRGLHPSAGIAFMLAAPIVNPIVIVSTWVAFGGGRLGAEMVGGRCGLGLLVAIAAGALIGRHADVLRPRAYAAALAVDEHASRPAGFTTHLTTDFVFMARFLVLGAGLSALLQTVVPQTVISSVAGSAVVGALALMALAFMLSLCSEADAFVATSFTAFPLASQLAFLVLGPVADTKLAVLYGATFRRGFVVRLLVIAVPLILAASLVFGAVVT